MRPQIRTLRTDVALFQEVNGQNRPGAPRDVYALRRPENTDLEGADIAGTRETDGDVLGQQNLVIATRHPSWRWSS